MKLAIPEFAVEPKPSGRMSGTLATIGLFAGLVLCIVGVCASTERMQILTIALGSQLLLAVGFSRLWPSAVDADSADEPECADKPSGLLRDENGHVAVEVGLSFPLVFVVMVGTFTFGQTLFTYNMLQSSMRSAARYASLAAYDLPNGTDWKAQVKNMAVFGDPDPGAGAIPLAPGLTLAHVNVSALLVEGEPERVTVAVHNLDIHNLFGDITVSRPVVVFPFLGRVLVP